MTSISIKSLRNKIWISSDISNDVIQNLLRISSASTAILFLSLSLCLSKWMQFYAHFKGIFVFGFSILKSIFYIFKSLAICPLYDHIYSFKDASKLVLVWIFHEPTNNMNSFIDRRFSAATKGIKNAGYTITQLMFLRRKCAPV